MYCGLIISLLVLDVKAFRKIYLEEKHILIKMWNFIKDYRTFISFFIAWMITNGWCYVFIFLGSILRIKWMRIAGWSYLAFLWMPFTPEKVVTIPLGIAIKKFLFRRKK